MTILAIIYVIFLLLWAILSFLGLYQLYQFGYEGDASRRVIAGYAIASLAVIIITLVAFIAILR